MQKIIDKIKEIANNKKYGRIVIELTYQKGCVTKATIKESDEVILINKDDLK